MQKYLTVGILLIAGGGKVLASTENKLEELVVVSSQVEMPLRRIGTSVSVITADEIELKGYTALYDVLRSQTAIAASNTGGSGSATALRIRGEESYRTRVYIDGIDVSDTSGTQAGPNMEHILSSGVERVEILRGPQGLMYGADAGGIVNISTQSSAESFSGGVSAEGGSYGHQQWAANLYGGNDALDFSLHLADMSTDGFSSRTTDVDLKDDDGYENTTLHGRVGWNVTDDLRVQLVARDVSGDNEYDDCYTVETFSPSNACSNEFEQQSSRVDVDYVIGSFTHNIAYSQSDTERAFFTEDAYGFGAEGELERWSYLGSFSASDTTRLVYGVDVQQENMYDGTFDQERDREGYYLEYQGAFGEAFYVTAGVRSDDTDEFGTETTYRLSGAYVIPGDAGDYKIKAAYGTGFRPPSLYEIAYNGGFFAYPPASDVTLTPETSAGFDIGIAWFGDSGTVFEATYFDQKVEDELYFDLIAYSGYLQDSGETTSRGVELSFDSALTENLSLTANYTYNDTESSTESTRARRPEQLANLGFTWDLLNGRLRIGTSLRGAYDVEDINGQSMDDYTLFNASISYQFTDQVKLYGRVENALDEDYQEVPFYNTAKSAAFAGVRFSF